MKRRTEPLDILIDHVQELRNQCRNEAQKSMFLCELSRMSDTHAKKAIERSVRLSQKSEDLRKKARSLRGA